MRWNRFVVCVLQRRKRSKIEILVKCTNSVGYARRNAIINFLILNYVNYLVVFLRLSFDITEVRKCFSCSQRSMCKALCCSFNQRKLKPFYRLYTQNGICHVMTFSWIRVTTFCLHNGNVNFDVGYSSTKEYALCVEGTCFKGFCWEIEPFERIVN